ncbi:MAG TPA: response regulator [Rectinemataceae bacterium]|nr:response regulator [Rectinemataceae bacterium]
MKGRTELAPGIWRVGAMAPGQALDINCYLIPSGEGYVLVDAGPASLAREIIRLAEAVAPCSAIHTIVLLDESPFAVSALAAWTAAGFRGRVLADWRVVAGLSLASVDVGFRDLREADLLIGAGTSGELRILRPEGSSGSIALFHAASGTLFSGRIGSSMGKDLPEYCSDPGLSAQRSFMDSFGYGLGLDASSLPKGGEARLLCPRFGSLVAAPLARELLALSCLPETAACPDAPDDLAPLMLELESLRSSNYELREAMVGASDAALRDPATQLYGRGYADAFVQELCGRKSEFSAAFIRVDHIRELNREIGAQSVDLIIRDLASILQEMTPEGYLFRWTGPIILLILQNSGEGVTARLEALRLAIAAERRFVRPITVSIALVRCVELPAEGFGVLQSLARERLRLLDRRGGDALLDRSDIHVEDRALVLALDSNDLFLDFLVESLEHEGFRTQGASRGGAALELIDGTRPELVIAEVSLPQFDAFQIRTRMHASSDLHDIPFILLTDVKTDEIVARAHSLGIFHIFEKPVSMVELTGIARSLLARNEDGA